MKKLIEVKVIDNYGRQVKRVTFNNLPDAEKAAAYYRNWYFDNVKIIITDITGGSKK